MKIPLIVFLFLSSPLISISQVLNVDREIENDTSFRRVRASFNFNFSNDKQKGNLVDFANNSEIDFIGTTFVQFPLNSRYLTPRWFFDSNLYFNVNKPLGFIIDYDYNFDTLRPLPIDNYEYTASTGINFKF